MNKYNENKKKNEVIKKQELVFLKNAVIFMH